MKTPPLNETFREMTAVFDELLASLSTLKGLGSLDLGHCGEGQLLQEALVSLVENYGVERCALFFVEVGSEHPATAVAWNNGTLKICSEGKNACCDEVSPLEVAFVDQVIRSGDVRICDDCLDDDELKPLATKDSPRSMLGAPLVVGGERVGALLLAASEPQRFGAWQQRFIPLFALFLGQAMMSSRLLHNLENQVRERTSQLENVLRETHELKERYQSLAMVDALTGLYNRRFFFSEGGLVVARALRYRHTATFVIIDLDFFKRVNDRYGHGVGDQVLKDVAEALRGQLRETDILARIGGEEFALILPETGIEGATELTGRLCKSVRDLVWSAKGEDFGITFSAGVVALPLPSESSEPRDLGCSDMLERLFSQADKALYDAKAQGGDRVEVGVL